MQKEKAGLQCLICMEKEDNKTIIEKLCNNDHTFCSSCIEEHFWQLVRSNEPIVYKCPSCECTLFKNKLEVILSEDLQIALAKNALFEIELPDGLEFMECPTCPEKKKFIFLVKPSDYYNIFKCEQCGKTCCLYCKNECSNNDLFHSTCNLFIKVAEDISNARYQACHVRCGNCKIAKREDDNVDVKDDQCTHLAACKKCNHRICYVCGLSENKVKGGDIYKHSENNDNWMTNDDCCPMYLENFYKIVPSWPRTNASPYFHEYKVNAYISKVIEKHGLENVKKAYEHFKDKKLSNVHSDFIYKNGERKIYQFLEKRIYKSFSL